MTAQCGVCGQWFADEDERDAHEASKHATSILEFGAAGDPDEADQ